MEPGSRGGSVAAAACRMAAGQERPVVVGHGDAGEQEQAGQRGEGCPGDVGLVAVQPPYQGVHRAALMLVSGPGVRVSSCPM